MNLQVAVTYELYPTNHELLKEKRDVFDLMNYKLQTTNYKLLKVPIAQSSSCHHPARYIANGRAGGWAFPAKTPPAPALRYSRPSAAAAL